MIFEKYRFYDFRKKIILIFCCVLFEACGQSAPAKNEHYRTTESTLNSDSSTFTNGSTIAERFSPPENYERAILDSISFSTFLRNLPLKNVGSEVTYFDGRTKPNYNVYAAVVDLPIGKRDLHQCADAVIRLRADYFYKHGKYDSIQFNFTNGFKADYARWRNGQRIIVQGNKVFWRKNAEPSDSPINYWKYLEMVFSYAGTASLEKEMTPIALEELQIGDVFIKGGFPGHAVIVVDMAIHKSNNEKIILLAQSYMPAQEIQILQNPNNNVLSPWYKLSDIKDELATPEWTFKPNQLKRF